MKLLSILLTEVRLVDGPSRNEGRLEIFHDDQWGNVCNDDISLEEVAVFCRMMEFG